VSVFSEVGRTSDCAESVTAAGSAEVSAAARDANSQQATSKKPQTQDQGPQPEVRITGILV
jgi:pyrimidine deaminase RibD-like protein